MSKSSGRHLTWYTQPSCTLCDAAWPHVERATTLLRLEVTVVDITADPALHETYGMRIPVLAHRDTVLAEGAMSAWDVWRSAFRVRLR